jgi:hypothetical protein
MHLLGKGLRKELILILIVCLFLPVSALSGTVDVKVGTRDGKAVKDAVVVAVPRGIDPPEVAPAENVLIDQVDKQFVNHVTVVPVGTAISFPNNDQIRHHVYSFSPVKTFEIPLYKGMPDKPVVFDKPGIVALGCNIHDWMSAYVFVVDSPYYSVTGEDGKTSLDLPEGEYELTSWHPGLRGSVEQTKQTVNVSSSPDSVPVGFEINLKKVWSPRRGPERDGGGAYP